MHKYDIRIGQSKFSLALIVTFCLVCVYSVTQWQPHVMLAQQAWQLLFAILITALGIDSIRQGKLKSRFSRLLVDENGQCLIPAQGDFIHASIGGRSRVLGPLIWLFIDMSNKKHKKSSGSGCFLLCKDQCTEQDFRRLCRIVMSVRR